MKYGLSQIVIDSIVTCLMANENIEQAILYGSRAKGNFKNGSDIDLVLKGNALQLNDVYQLEDKLDDLLLPYQFDISLYHHIDNLNLIEHISRVGILFYETEKLLTQ